MSKYYFISEPSQFDELKHGDTFESTCVLCGNKWEVKKFIKSKLEKYKLMMCGRCRCSYIQKHFSKERLAIKCEKIRQTKLEKYGDPNYNNRAKSAETCEKKFGSTSPLANHEVYKATQLTRLKKYGSLNYVTTNEFKEKKAKTQLEKYGDPNYTNRTKFIETWNAKTPEEKEAFKNKLSSTLHDKYNVNSVGELLRSEEYINHSKQTKLEKYGDPNYTNTKKASNTKLERYGDPYYNNPEKQKAAAKKYGENYTSVFQAPEVQELSRKSIREKYGVENPMRIPGFQKKSAETKLKRYGNPHYTNPDKISSTKLERYGRTGGFSYKYNYYGIMFDSSWELAVWIYCIDHGIPIVRSPFVYTYIDESSGKEKKYYLDFWINGKLVEIKGDQFTNDETGFKSPYKEANINNSELPSKYKLIQSLGNIEVWYQKECEPYIQYARMKYGYYFNKLFNIHNLTNPSYSGLNGFVSLVKPYLSTPITYSYPVFPGKGVFPHDMKPDSDGFVIPSKSVNPYDVGLLK